ncbi:MAG: DUF86 domain-containing protein [Spirochaetales bacterium]|nr:DUF86 domain-containing protein [Spirochaetales bacterium]
MSDRLSTLDENLRILEEFRSTPPRNRRDEWALRYGLLESIQIVIDVACELVALRNLGTPKSYRECIILLERHGILSSDVAARTASMVGLRNLLVHEYDEIDIQRLTPLLSRLDDFRQFAAEVTAHWPDVES